jgi:fatty acid-binding protein DegV
MLKLGILIDASAEVPASVLANPHVRLLPVSIQIDNQMFVDERNDAFTRDFNRQYLSLRAAEVSQSVPPSTEVISKYLVSHIAGDFDHVFGLFVASTRSPIFKNAFTASAKAINDTMAQRTKMGIKGPLLVECHDSLNVFAGYGVQVMEVLRQFEAEPSATSIRANIQRLSKNAYCYVAPSQLDFIVTRAKAKGENSVGAFGKAAAKMLGILPILRGHQGATEAVAKLRGIPAAQAYVLDMARRELQRGLLAPFINVTYSGTIETVKAMPAYNQLCGEASAKGVTVSLQETSPTGSINVGPNALGVGFIGNTHTPVL